MIHRGILEIAGEVASVHAGVRVTVEPVDGNTSQFRLAFGAASVSPEKGRETAAATVAFLRAAGYKVEVIAEKSAAAQ